MRSKVIQHLPKFIKRAKNATVPLICLYKAALHEVIQRPG